MKPRIIGVKSCRFCNNLFKTYKQLNVDFEYWDGEREDLQDSLDKMKIYKFPVVQLLNDEGNVIFTWDNALYPRGVSYRTVELKMAEIEKRNKK